MIRPGVQIPAGELEWKFSRSSGPGGQSVNTSDSRVSLSFDLRDSPSLDPRLRDRALRRLAGRLADGVLTVHADRERSQYLNRLAAAKRLAAVLRAAIAPPGPQRRATRPSAAAKQRRITAKKQRGQIKRWRAADGDQD